MTLVSPNRNRPVTADAVVTDRRPSLPSGRALLVLGLLVDLAAVAACAWAAARPGKGMDVSFDLLNYHYYYSWLFFHGGIGQVDPEPFGGRYQNPVVEFPWYLLDQSLSPRLAAAAIGAVAGLALPLVRRITLLLVTGRGTVTALGLSVAAVLVAAVGADFQVELGTSMADVVVSLPMLTALLFVLKAARAGVEQERRGSADYLLAGLFSGLAVGAKLTMGSYALALAVTVALLAMRGRSARVLVQHLLGGAAGAMVTGGWWFYSLWRLTGNPVFPFYNSIFRSGDWPLTDVHDLRFGPYGLLDAARYPLYLLLGTRRVLDVTMRDPRWAVLAVLAAVAVVSAVVRFLAAAQRPGARSLARSQPGALAAWRARSLARSVRSVRSRRPSTVPPGVLTVFLVFFLLSGFTWLFQFGISRYGVLSEMLVGPLMVSLLALLVGGRLAAPIGAGLAAAMLPFSGGYFYHVPFQPDRFMVDAAPLKAVPAGSVVISDAATTASGFLLTYLPPGVKRHVVHPGFYDTPILKKLQAQQLAVAPRIYVIEGGFGPRVATNLAKNVNLRLLPRTCVPLHSSVQLRYLCEARWVTHGR